MAEPSVCCSGLARVVRGAEGLPVGSVPELLPVSAVRFDVVDVSGNANASSLLTFDAERVFTKVDQSCSSPLSVIESCVAVGAPTVNGTLACLLVGRATATSSECSALRVRAWG